MMLAGRAMDKDDFGAFTLTFSALLFANMIQAGLVTQPHNILGTSRHGHDYARYTSSTAVAQLYIAAFGTIVSLLVWLFALAMGYTAAPLMLALAASIFAWQMQEFVRRVLYTKGRIDAAFVNDIISYGGQTALIAVLYRYNQLTGARALYALAITSALAALVGAWQIRHSLTRDFLPTAMRDNWRNAVDAYITPSESAKRKFIEGGLPADKITVKPHFLPTDPGVGEGDGDYAVFVGRLSFEKGVETLLAAWEKLKAPLPLKMIGDGPLADLVRASVAKDPRITWLGRKSLNEIYDVVGRAKMLIFPSQCYESFGRVAIEAYARGTPVVATDHGAMADVVDNGRTGLRFAPGSPQDLADRVQQLLDHPTELAKMRMQARGEFETKYTAPSNYERLMRIYENAIARAQNAPIGQELSPLSVPGRGLG
jgi:glycosyltransferase involved in cell wall biosynthesis